MITIECLGPLGGKILQSHAKTLQELKEELKLIPELEHWLPECAIAINAQIIHSLNTPLKNGDTITLLPPVCGG